MKRPGKDVSAIVLAAGESKRMGRTKQLLPFGAGTILEEVVASVIQSGVDEVIVVLGYQADVIAPLVAGAEIKTVTNMEHAEGIGASLRCGVRHASEKAQAFMIVLGDQPLTGGDILRDLLAQFTRGGRGIAAPVYQGQQGHPVIFSARYRDELAALGGDRGARDVLAAHPDDVLYVEVADPGVITDIDTEEEYQLLYKQSGC